MGNKKPPGNRGFVCARYWDRTSASDTGPQPSRCQQLPCLPRDLAVLAHAAVKPTNARSRRKLHKISPDLSTKRKRRESFGAVRRTDSGRYQASQVGPDRVRRNAPKTFDTLTAGSRCSRRESLVANGHRWRRPHLKPRRAGATRHSRRSRRIGRPIALHTATPGAEEPRARHQFDANLHRTQTQQTWPSPRGSPRNRRPRANTDGWPRAPPFTAPLAVRQWRHDRQATRA